LILIAKLRNELTKRLPPFASAKVRQRLVDRGYALRATLTPKIQQLLGRKVGTAARDLTVKKVTKFDQLSRGKFHELT
jgi:hypothetical protein